MTCEGFLQQPGGCSPVKLLGFTCFLNMTQICSYIFRDTWVPSQVIKWTKDRLKDLLQVCLLALKSCMSGLSTIHSIQCAWSSPRSCSCTICPAGWPYQITLWSSSQTQKTTVTFRGDWWLKWKLILSWWRIGPKFAERITFAEKFCKTRCAVVDVHARGLLILVR